MSHLHWHRGWGHLPLCRPDVVVLEGSSGCSGSDGTAEGQEPPRHWPIGLTTAAPLWFWWRCEVAAKGDLMVHTDGACSGNPGPGGWSVVFSLEGAVVGEFCGGEPGITTSNRMDTFFGDAGMADRTLWPKAFGLRTPAPLR
jgi:hypothetical protein